MQDSFQNALAPWETPDVTTQTAAGRGRIRVILWGVLPLLGALLIGVTPLTATALLIYESAPNGPLATPFVDPSPFGDPPPVIVDDPLAYQSLGVKFYVSEKVKTGSIGGYFAPYPNPTDSEIIGAIVRLEGPSDFPNSLDLTTKDVLGKTTIHISQTAGNYAGDLSKMLSVGWYALVFAATTVTSRTTHSCLGWSRTLGSPCISSARRPPTPD